MRTDLFSKDRFDCSDCGVFITKYSAYFTSKEDETPRCWLCHCRALGAWDEEKQRPAFPMDREGYPIGRVSVEVN